MGTYTVNWSGEDYATVSAAISAIAGTFTVDEIIILYPDFGGHDDRPNFNGAVTTASAKWIFQGKSGATPKASWQSATSVATMAPSTGGNVIAVNDPFSIIEDLQILINTASVGAGVLQASTDGITRRTFIDGQDSTNTYGIYNGDGGETYRNIVTGCKRAFYGGIRTDGTAVHNIYGNTVDNCDVGIRGASTNHLARNNISTRNTRASGDYWSSTFSSSSSNNTSSDTTAPGTSAATGVTATNVFVSLTAGAEDYTLKSTATTEAVDNGVSLGGDYDIDILGNSPNGTPDRGAVEFYLSGEPLSSFTPALMFARRVMSR